jgi:hypothetical protein
LRCRLICRLCVFHNLDYFIRRERRVSYRSNLRAFVVDHVRAFAIVVILALLFSKLSPITVVTVFGIVGPDFAELERVVVGLRQLLDDRK